MNSKKDLFVVLGCIVFLLMTLGAIGSGGRRRAKEAVCLSNLKQWGSVFQTFASDNDGYFMAGWMGRALTKHTDQWPSALRPYYANYGDLRLCPSAKIPVSERRGPSYTWPTCASEAWGVFPDPPGWPVKAGDYGSYGINAWVGNPLPESPLYEGPWAGMDKAHWRTPNVKNAATVPLFGDCLWLEAWPTHMEAPPPFPEAAYLNPANSMYRLFTLRHGKHLNFLFLDYSVSRVEYKQLWTLKWNRKFNTCGIWTKCGGVQRDDWPEWMRDLPYE